MDLVKNILACINKNISTIKFITFWGSGFDT